MLKKHLIVILLVFYFVKNSTLEGSKNPDACESELQTQCDNGDCIQRIEFCDGIPHCIDGSDETLSKCFNKTSCLNGFQCKYGACISIEKKCDDKKDCVDNSDESVEYAGCKEEISPFTPITIYTPSLNTKCSVPDIKNLIIYQNKTDSSYTNRLSPGDMVESSIKPLYYACKNRYFLRENDDTPDSFINYCIDGVWTKQHPSCIKLCSSEVLSGISFLASCNGKKNDCQLKKYHLPGTIAKISCVYNYEEPDYYRNSLLCEEDGNWDYTPQRCEQKCGILSDLLVPYILDDNVSDVNHFPWHASIFYQDTVNDEYRNICGGTIITPRLIISAGRCFWNKICQFDERKFKIVVGTLARNYTDRSLNSQTFSIEKIIPHENFGGPDQEYLYDIAIAVLNSTINYNDLTLPICIHNYLHTKIDTGVMGKIAGWNQVNTNQLTLRYTEVMSITYNDCKNKTEQYLTPDKFCIDTKNSTESNNCYGDIGGGFVQLIKERNIEKYFLRGILSTGFHRLTCGNNIIAGFTDIYTHDFKQFIDNTQNLYNPK